MRYALNQIKSMLGLNKNLFRNTPGARIVIYHGICRNNPTLINSLFITADVFEEHLQFYKEHFNIVTLKDFYAGRFSDDKFNICITFDDGFANNHRYVLPLMDKYRVPVTFFITAIRKVGYDLLWNDQLALLQKFGPSRLSFGDTLYQKHRQYRYLSTTGSKSLREHLQNEGFPLKESFLQQTAQIVQPIRTSAGEDYWLQMTEDEIKELSVSPYAAIGCHGYYHNDLSKIPLAEATGEMLANRQYLEKITGRNVDSIAFPYGAYTREVIAAAADTGFQQLLAVDFLYPEDSINNLLRQRMTINPYISVYNQMTAIVRGKYTF